MADGVGSLLSDRLSLISYVSQVEYVTLNRVNLIFIKMETRDTNVVCRITRSIYVNVLCVTKNFYIF